MRLLPADSVHGWTPYVWLIYLAPYVGYPFVTGIGGPVLALHALGLVAFLALYFRAYWVDGGERVPLIAGLAVLGLALCAINPGALTFVVFAAGFVGGAVTSRRAPLVIVILAVLAAAATGLLGWPAYFAAGVGLLALMIGFVNLHYSDMRQRDASLRLARDEIARLAALAERDRIAADLHDLLGHTLSLIVLKSALASKLLPRDQPRAAAEIADVERISREALHEVRQAVQGFRSATLTDELVRAREALAAAGVTLAEEIAPVTLPRATEHALALVLREAVTNIVRHARARHCRISLDISSPVTLKIEDDGVGGEVREGSGFASMRARLREIGGTLEHDGRHGTRIVARVPGA